MNGIKIKEEYGNSDNCKILYPDEKNQYIELDYNNFYDNGAGFECRGTSRLA